MKPKEIFQKLEADGFKRFVRADIILTNNLSGMFARLIRLKTNGKCSHAEMYAFTGHSIGANRNGVNINNLKRFFNGRTEVCVYRRKGLKQADRTKILYNACRWLHRPYDWPGVICQGLDWIFRTTSFSRKFNGSYFPYCSELIGRACKPRKVSSKPIEVATPQNILDFVGISPKWKLVFHMLKVDGEWHSNIS